MNWCQCRVRFLNKVVKLIAENNVSESTDDNKILSPEI